MSKRPYECFRCRDNGFPNTMVYLAGKDEQGKTVYIEDDGTAHRHKVKQQVSSAANVAVTTEEEQEVRDQVKEASMPLLRIIDAKLDRVISMLEKQQEQGGQSV